MKISVIIATYNGEKYIEEQLSSIAKQTLQVNEVMIIDDCSTDSTVELVSRFIQKNFLTNNWCVKKNKKNVGWKENFFKGFNEVKGDIIFYCDQDDIWFPNKVCEMVQILVNNSNISCLACRYRSINSNGDIINATVDKKSNETKKIMQIKPYSKNFFSVPSGCTIAFKRNMLSLIDMLDYRCGPDRVICRTAILMGKMYDYDSTLMYHRFHSNNASNSIQDVECLSGSSSLDERVQYVDENIFQMQNFKRLCDSSIYVDNLLSFDINRINYLRGGNLLYQLKNIFKIRCLYMLVLVLGDVAYKNKINKISGKVFKWIKTLF